MTYIYLFLEFFKIGLFAIGGGPATLPFLSELANKSYGWYSQQDLANFIAISEGTPGPIGVNMATYAGYHAGGILGGVIATLGLIAPSLIIILIVARFLKDFGENRIVKSVFYGIRPAVAGLITVAVLNLFGMALYTLKDSVLTLHWQQIAFCLILFGCMQIKKLKKLHPIIWLAAAAVVGIIFKFK